MLHYTCREVNVNSPSFGCRQRLSIRFSESFLAALNLSPETFEAETRLALAVKLYELGRLSSGQAATLAGVPRATFLLTCPHFGTASVQWDREELEAEFSEPQP